MTDFLMVVFIKLFLFFWGICVSLDLDQLFGGRSLLVSLEFIFVFYITNCFTYLTNIYPLPLL